MSAALSGKLDLDLLRRPLFADLVRNQRHVLHDAHNLAVNDHPVATSNECPLTRA